jgi:hypothetical protein
MTGGTQTQHHASPGFASGGNGPQSPCAQGAGCAHGAQGFSHGLAWHWFAHEQLDWHGLGAQPQAFD